MGICGTRTTQTPQVNWDKMEGMRQDGQMPQLPRGMMNFLGVASAPLDTTGLENSFENLGRTMVDVLYYTQQQTKVALQDQIRRGQ